MRERIYIKYDGWIVVHPDTVSFNYTGDDKTKKINIDGDLWACLPADQRQEYQLDDLPNAIKDCEEGETHNLEVDVVEKPVKLKLTKENNINFKNH